MYINRAYSKYYVNINARLRLTILKQLDAKLIWCDGESKYIHAQMSGMNRANLVKYNYNSIYIDMCICVCEQIDI